MKKFYLSLMTMICVMSLSAQGLRYKGFSGGMMVHGGYVCEASVNESFDGFSSFTKGIGGAARVHLGDYLRVGAEGYVSTANYDENASYVSLGWGGVLADFALNVKKFCFYVGTSFGGGSVQHLQRNYPLKNDFVHDPATNYRNYATMLMAPYLGMEYALNDGIHLTAKVDYTFPVSGKPESVCDFPVGPRLYVGFLFYRMK